MNQTLVKQEIRKMKFEELYTARTEHRLTVEQAAEILGVHERTFRRWTERYEENGAEGLLDKRIGKKAHNRAPVDEVANVLNLFETQYRHFHLAHFHDRYRFDHGGTRSYGWVKKILQDAGLVRKAKKRGPHRVKRPRRPMIGMMIHQDASTHNWIESEKWDLIVTMDDATSEIYSAFFVDEEGTMSSMRGVKEVIESKGIFCSFYSDRGSHYWHTPKAGGKVDKSNPTQFGEALKLLGIDMIAAYSPEARGRSERMFGTLQGRLPNELKLHNIQDMDSANSFLKDKFIPEFNKRFTVKPQDSESAFVPWLTCHLNLDDILCLKEQRTVYKDNTVKYKGKTLQLFKTQYRYSYAKTTVMVHEYANNEMAIFHGPRCIARYNSKGEFLPRPKQREHQDETLLNTAKQNRTISVSEKPGILACQ